MKRAELTKLGLSKEQIKGVQELHRRDMQYVDMNGPKTKLIDAITGMLPTLRKPDHLRDVLTHVTRLYYLEGKQLEADLAAAAQENDPLKALEIKAKEEGIPVTVEGESK